MDTKRMQELREKHFDTQATLAEKLNVTKRAYASWERNERDIPNDILVRIADLYGISTDFILGRDLPTENELPPPDDIAAHTDSAMTPEMKAEVEEIARKFLLKYLTNK